MKKLLFLDDVRWPIEAYSYTKQDIFLMKKWDIVRNYEDLVNYITKKGLPDFISFDHDLADEHYLKANAEDYLEKTGYDCAKWLVEYCMDNHEKCPSFFCHSMNPVGKEKIESLLNQFKNNKNEYT